MKKEREEYNSVALIVGLDSGTVEKEKAGAMQEQAKRKKHTEMQNGEDCIIAEWVQILQTRQQKVRNHYSL